MESAVHNELPIQDIKQKIEFTQRYLKPLLQVLNPSIFSVVYDYCAPNNVVIDEHITVSFSGGSFLRVGVTRSSLAQIALDTIKVVVGEVKA